MYWSNNNELNVINSNLKLLMSMKKLYDLLIDL